MQRRATLKGVETGAEAGGAAGVPMAKARGSGKAAFVLVHGSWHGAWCWGLVEPTLNDTGFMTIPIDLPGHGLNARLPQTFSSRPLDAASFATEPSFLADIGIEEYVDTVAKAVEQPRAAGADKVIGVGHSMGGVPITFAAAKSPRLFDGLVYLAAVAPTPGEHFQCLS